MFSHLQAGVIRIRSFSDAHGPLVNVEVGPDSVTRPVSVIEADVPQVLPSERVEAVALDLARKDRGREADLTLEDAREGLLLERLRSAEVNSSGNKIILSHSLIFSSI
jgi:hypothetical protein